MTKVAMILAVSNNNVIGKNNTIPWHIPEDFRFFKEVTKGSVVIMGRNTWESLGCKPLPGRINIIISSKPSCHETFLCTPSECKLWKTSLDEALDYARSINAPQAFIIGGVRLYTEGLEKCSEIYRTVVDTEIEIDENTAVFEHELTEDKWRRMPDLPARDTDCKWKYTFQCWGRK